MISSRVANRVPYRVINKVWNECKNKHLKHGLEDCRMNSRMAYTYRMTDSLNASLSKLSCSRDWRRRDEVEAYLSILCDPGSLVAPLLKLKFEEEVTSRERFLATALSKCGVWICFIYLYS